ncbi:MAG: PilZ domain-containing protein [Gemmataceae bacterium]
MYSLFAQSLSNGSQLLPVLVGGGVACVIVISVGIWMGISAQRRKQFPVIVRPEAETWSPPEGTGADRRSTVRREGQAVPVLLNSAALRNQPLNAYVIDRSTGGLKIVSTTQVPGGTTMQVRAENAPDSIPWVTVIVRSCRVATGNGFELGCEFEKTPPWSILLLFG